jgi:hypothetical protein
MLPSPCHPSTAAVSNLTILLLIKTTGVGRSVYERRKRELQHKITDTDGCIWAGAEIDCTHKKIDDDKLQGSVARAVATDLFSNYFNTAEQKPIQT